MSEQTHLSHVETVNLGSYYTPPDLVDAVYGMIQKNEPDWRAFRIIDTSCGYGNFLRFPRSIGADFDPKAIQEAGKQTHECTFFRHNSLSGVSRRQYGLAKQRNPILLLYRQRHLQPLCPCYQRGHR